MLSPWSRALLTANVVSSAGTALQGAALSWTVWRTTGSAADLSLLALAQATPLLGLPLLGGRLADRFPHRTLLLLTQSLLALLAGTTALLAWQGHLTVSLAVALAGGFAAIAALDNPIRQVYLPGVLPPELRGRVIGLNALAFNAGAVIGPATAGLLLPLTGPGGAFALNAASFVPVLGLVLFGSPGAPSGNSPVPRPKTCSPLPSRVLALLALVAAVSFLGRSYPQVLPALANGTWGADVRAYGMLAALPGVGALAGATLSAWWLGRSRASVTIALATAFLGGAVLLLALAPSALTAAPALLLAGGGATFTMTLLNAALQHAALPGQRGRVMGTYVWLASGLPALGGSILGWSMQHVGSTLSVALLGTALLGVGMVEWWARRQEI